MKSRLAIKRALEEEDKTFSKLLEETGLSRSALAFHLKEMHKEEDVERRTDPNDYRITYYSLTSKGRGELQREEDIEVISSWSVLPTPKTYAALYEAVIKSREPATREHILENEEAKNLREYITYSVYSKKPLKDAEKNNLARALESATTSFLRNLILPPKRVADQFKKKPKIPNFTLVVRFNAPKIEEYKRKIEIEANKEPLQRLPDTRDCLGKRKRED